MAKKSKKSKKFFKVIPFVLLLIAVAVLCMGFLPGVTYTPERGDPYSVNGFRLAFGGTIENLSGNLGSLASQKTTITFSILTLLCLALPFIGALLAIILKGKLGAFFAFLCFLFAGITFFFIPQVTSVKFVTTILGGESTSTATFSKLGYGLGVGSIIGAVLSIIGAVGAAVDLVFDK